MPRASMLGRGATTIFINADEGGFVGQVGSPSVVSIKSEAPFTVEYQNRTSEASTTWSADVEAEVAFTVRGAHRQRCDIQVAKPRPAADAPAP